MPTSEAQVDAVTFPETPGDSATQLYRLLEEHFDEMGLSIEDRDSRYVAAAEFVIAENGALAKSST